MKRLEKISVLTAKLKKAVAEEGIGGLAGRTKGYLARAKKEKEFQREKSRVYRDILFISGCNEQLPHPHRYRVVHQMEQLEAGGYTCDTVYFQESHFSRFTSLKMFHVKHRFLRFSVFGNQ